MDPLNDPFDLFLIEEAIIERARDQIPYLGPVVQVFRYHPWALAGPFGSSTTSPDSP